MLIRARNEQVPRFFSASVGGRRRIGVISDKALSPFMVGNGWPDGKKQNKRDSAC